MDTGFLLFAKLFFVLAFGVCLVFARTKIDDNTHTLVWLNGTSLVMKELRFKTYLPKWKVCLLY